MQFGTDPHFVPIDMNYHELSCSAYRLFPHTNSVTSASPPLLDGGVALGRAAYQKTPRY